MFSESPPLSGDKPPSLEKRFFMCNARNEEKLPFAMGGFVPPSEYRENNPDLQSEYE
ncbi:hypothetical protein [Arthrobacter sp. Bi83]|jgi:hypothetical protein|uniref:hypothetical protein n=1 Tax=Arthrobacter sp. Bi83 TaxID=2822353 RepID=UPI001E2C284C|nr:hypothetical protein [Arthrobacter sp. Bi83]